MALGERFAGARFAGLEADVVDNGRVPHPTLLAARDRMAAKPRGSYYLSGDFGAWKTYLAAAQWNALFDLHVVVRFISDVELYRALRAAEMGGPPLDTFGVEHLIIDDLGKKGVSPFVRTAYFDVIEWVFRTAGRIGLTITSNFASARLAYDDEGREVYDPGMVRRIDQICEALTISTSPRRKEP
jgi:DNA replication protein DnaC